MAKYLDISWHWPKDQTNWKMPLVSQNCKKFPITNISLQCPAEMNIGSKTQTTFIPF